MKYAIILLIGFAWSGLTSPLAAQESLTLEDAIGAALQNNYGIRLAAYDVRSSELDVSRGNAGLLPTLSMLGGANYNNNNAEVDVVAGTDPATGAAIVERVSATGVETSSANLGLNLNWTIFNGMANARRYELLSASAALTKEQTRNLVELNVIQVSTTYYQVARLENNYRILAQSLERSVQRLVSVKNQEEFGGANSIAVLNAQVDLNTDSVNLLTTALNLENAKRNLVYLIGLDLETTLPSVELTAQIEELPSLAELETMVLNGNSTIVSAEQNQQLNALNLQIAESGRYPSLSINGSYGLNYANNGPFSFAPRIFSYGLAGGVSLNVPIYNGSRVANGIQKAEITLAQSRLQQDQVEQQVMRDLRNAYFTYRNHLDILRLQELSVRAARENYERTQERFRLGQATGIEFRESQINLLNAENRLNDIRFDAKLSQLTLLQLSGTLVPRD